MVTRKDINEQLDAYFKDHRSLTNDEADAVAEVIQRRRRINPRVLHIEEVDDIEYVCKGIPEVGTFYVFGVLK